MAESKTVRWLEFASRVDGEAVEAVSEVFSRVAIGGVVVEPDLEPGADDGFTVGALATIRAYVPLDDAAPDKQRTVEEGLWHLRAIWPVGELDVREVADQEWATAWKKHYSTFRVGRRIVIRPSWLEYSPTADDVVVSLDPGAAFGTGLHPTTRRCLELLEEFVKPGATVLDVGTGSGILSLASAGLGASRIVAVDVDPIAVSAARDNVAAGNRQKVVDVRAGGVEVVSVDQQFDVVVANIIARVIIQILPRLVERLRPGGCLILGGVIADRSSDVARELTRLGITFHCHVDGDWFTYLARPAETS